MKVPVVFYPAYGHIYRMAESAEKGAAMETAAKPGNSEEIKNMISEMKKLF